MHIKSFSQKDRYGNSISIEFQDDSIPEMQAIPMPNFEPKGTDTVPAMLTPGEFVMNAEATRMFEPQIEAMNDAGKQVQEMQGGSIPEGGNIPGEPVYKGEGGFLSGLTSSVTGAIDSLTLPQAPPGIVYRRLPDGGIGKFTERSGTGGGQTYLGRLESAKPKKRREDTWNFSNLYNSKGGVIYAEAGRPIFQRKPRPSWLTDDLLDSLKGVESDGNPNALSEKGAAGLYQIMPATAASPGYFTQPITEAERYDPIKSREFADQYLSGIAYKHPEFSKDQVLQAYHSGVGNVQKAALDPTDPNYEPLGPRGEVYADKVNAGVESPSLLSKIGDAIIPKAYASTMYDEPPQVEEDSGSFMDLFKAKPNPSREEFNRKITNLNRDAVADDFKAMEAKRLANIEAGRDEFENINEKTYNGLKKAVEFQNQQVKEATDSSLELNKVDPGLAKAAKLKEQQLADEALVPSEEEMNMMKSPEYQAHVERAKAAGVQPDTPKERIEKSTKDESGTSPDMRMAGKVAAEPPKPPQSVTQSEADAIANSVVANLPDDKEEPDPDTGGKTEKEVEEKGFFDEGIGAYFKDAFKDLFNPKELARMVIMYTGSRALGYNHLGSLRYSMKNYMKRIDNIEQREYEAIKANKAAYTATSYAEYLESGDTSVLEAVAPEYKVGDSLYVPALGVVTSVDRDGVAYIDHDRDPSTPMERAVDHGAMKVEKNLHDPNEVSDRFLKSLEGYEKQITSGLKEDEKAVFATTDIADQARDTYFKYLNIYGRTPQDASTLQTKMNRALRKYGEAMQKFKASGGKGVDPTLSIEGFFLEDTVKMRMGLPQSLLKGTSPQNLLKLEQHVQNIPNQTSLGAMRYYDVAGRAWAWVTQNKKAGAFVGQGSEDNGHSDFSFWLDTLQSASVEDPPGSGKFKIDTNNRAYQIFKEYTDSDAYQKYLESLNKDKEA